MNGFKEIQDCIRSFICEKVQLQQQISNIEQQRIQLAQERNQKKLENNNCEAVYVLGKQISELGNQSQDLQNQLDFKIHEIKSQIGLAIDNLVAEGIRKIRLANEQIQDLNIKIEMQKDRNAKYQVQRQEFYLRFGRMPELSERAIKENGLQEKETQKNELEIQQLIQQIQQVEGEITAFAITKREIKNGNWNFVIESEENAEEIYIEELNIEEMEPIEEIKIEEFGPIEELYVEEFQPIEELKIEEFKEEDVYTEKVEPITENYLDEIEELARAIIEEIAQEQTRDYNIFATENDEEVVTIAQGNEKKEKVIIPLFGQRATILNITVKFEEGNLVYIAQMSDDNEVKIYPSKLGEQSVLLRDEQNREECKKILINFAIKEYRVLDKKVVNKIDPLVCELLIECADEYGYDAQELIYNYAMSFAGELENMPNIVYNLSYMKESNLNKKEKAILNKICRNARRNNGIEIIEAFSGFKKFKYIFKRIFTINNIKVLPEAKY